MDWKEGRFGFPSLISQYISFILFEENEKLHSHKIRHSAILWY